MSKAVLNPFRDLLVLVPLGRSEAIIPLLYWEPRERDFVERLNEHSLEDCLGRQKATAIYIVGGWVCHGFNRFPSEYPGHPHESTDIRLAHIRNRTEKGGTAREEEHYTAGMIAFVAPLSQHKCIGGC
jgi:hypothetical protein